MYLCFRFTLSPLQQYYLPYYLRSEMAGAMRPAGKYQLLYVFDASGKTRPALADDVKQGKSDQPSGKPIPLRLSPDALNGGARTLSGNRSGSIGTLVSMTGSRDGSMRARDRSSFSSARLRRRLLCC